MNKKEFKKLFSAAVNKLEEITGRRANWYKYANDFNFSVDTIKRWYQGDSVPNNTIRETVISTLYEKQERAKKVNFIKEVLRENLSIRAFRSDSIVDVQIYFDGDLIANDDFDL